VGIFAEDTQGRFGLTPLAELLRKDVPGSLYHTSLYIGAPHSQAIWGQLLHSVKTGETGAQHLYGMSAWDYRQQHPDLNDLFNGYMTELTSTDSVNFMQAYDFAGINKLIDLGGGHGTFVAEVLKANPQMRGIVFDLAHVVSGATPVLEAAGVADRCETIAGDFFGDLPRADGYLLKSILHDWDDDDSIRILQNVRRFIEPNGKLLIVDHVIPPGNQAHPGKQVDMIMLVVLGGRERTEAEFRTLLARGGFELKQISPTEGQSVIEAVPVK
jgi:SAM-dependent methyltransferase